MHPTLCKITAAAISLSMLAACGNNPGDRALSGGGLGAGVGALGAAAVGGSVAGGALIGAGVGAAAGALTNNHQINLGKPIWRHY